MASIDDVLNLPQRRILMPNRNVIMDQHEQIINKFFDDFLGNRKNFIHSNTSYPKMDIIEDDTYFRIRCAVPGLYKEDLDIEIVKESKLLTIKGSAKDSGYDPSKFHFHLKELKNLGIIQGTISGTSICYCINEENWNEIKTILNKFLNLTNPAENCCKN